MERKKLISYISLILFSLLFSYFFLWPKYIQFSDLKRAISELEKVLNSYQEYFKEIEDIFVKIKEKENEISKIKQALPLDPQIAETFNFLQKTASETGLLLKDVSFSVQKSEKESELGELKIQLQLSGTYPALKNFLAKVEKSARLIELENLSFSGEGKEIFDFKLSLKTFFIPK
jgi:Tfp pilus assembly protein PilO